MQTHRGALRAIERQRAAHERGQAAPETSGLARGALGLAATGALALGLAQYRKWKYQERQKKYDAATAEYRAISLRAKGKSHSAEALSAKQSRLVYRILKSGAVRESEGVAKLDLLDDGGFEWEDGSERAAIRKPESGQAILVSELVSRSPRFACTVRSLGDEQDQCIAAVPPLCAAMATELLCVKAAWGLAKWDIVVRALSKDGEWLGKEYPECSADVKSDVKAGEVRLACKAEATGGGSHVVAFRKDTCVPLSSNFGWFKDLFGFVDGSTEQGIRGSRERFDYDPNNGVLSLRSSVERWNAGTFELVSLGDLRVRARATLRNLQGHNTVRLLTQDPAILHGDPDYAGAIFQATAEHNCLQLRPAHGLAWPATLETGVASYVWDKSQGASCAIACAPGAVVRAYFALDGGKPQTNEDQINTLEPLIAFLTAQASDSTRPLVRVKNGYVDLSDSNSAELGRIINGLSEKRRETAKGLLRVGWQKNTAVTCTKKRVWSDEPWYKGPGHLVHQVYASPLYVLHSEREWEPLARLVLEAAYEATMLVAVLVGAEKGTRQTVVLTALGREAGSVTDWVADSVVSALAKFEGADLDVVINKGGARGIECDRIMSRIWDATARTPAAAAPVVMYTE